MLNKVRQAQINIYHIISLVHGIPHMSIPPYLKYNNDCHLLGRVTKREWRKD